MKKILIPIISILLLGLIVIIILSNNKSVDIEFYSILENYSFVEKENGRINFYVYSVTDNPLISYPDKNSYQVKLDNQSFNLNNVECNTYASGDYYIVNIEGDVPDITDTEYLSDGCKLHIVNGSYTLDLNMGSFSIIDSNYYSLLALDALSGTYSYTNGIKNLVGMNIKLSNDYSYLTSFRVGGFTYGTLSKTKFDLELDSEADIDSSILNYKYNQVEENYTLGISSNTMFIPMGYLNFALTKCGYLVLELDGTCYYFDAFPFMTTNPILTKYEDIKEKGEVINA